MWLTGAEFALEGFDGCVPGDQVCLGFFLGGGGGGFQIKSGSVVRSDATTGLVAGQGLIKVIRNVWFYVSLILFLCPSVDTDCVATPAVATDFSFNHLQRSPGQTPEWHIFGLRPGTGGTGSEGRGRRCRPEPCG